MYFFLSGVFHFAFLLFKFGAIVSFQQHMYTECAKENEMNNVIFRVSGQSWETLCFLHIYTNIIAAQSYVKAKSLKERRYQRESLLIGGLSLCSQESTLAQKYVRLHTHHITKN